MQKCQFCVKKIEILSTTIKSDHLFAKHAYSKKKKNVMFFVKVYIQ